jgi:uncharacterized protein
LEHEGSRGLIRRHALASFFAVAYGLSGVAFLLLVPRALVGNPPPSGLALGLFPIMVIGVGLAGVALTAICDGRAGLRALGTRLDPRRALSPWLVAALVPPIAILAVLGVLSTLVSPAFTVGFFPLGFAFGVPAGLFEELGWTGFAFPRMAAWGGAFRAAIALGIIWGVWHLPEVDFLGAASPHGGAWPAFFAAFVFALTVLRVLIAWVYVHTSSIVLAQLIHASSTGFLVALSPAGVSPMQEAVWYAGYGVALLIIVLVVVQRGGFSTSNGADPRP